MFARCVVRSRVGFLNAIIGPVVEGTGAAWKGHRVADAPRRAQKPKTVNTKNHRSFVLSEAGDTPEAKEAAFLARLRGIGARLG